MNRDVIKRYRALAEFVRERAGNELLIFQREDPRSNAPALRMHVATANYFLAALEYAESAPNPATRRAWLEEPRRFLARLEHIAQRWAYHPDYDKDWTP